MTTTAPTGPVADYTIYLDVPMVADGGVIILLPRELPADPEATPETLAASWKATRELVATAQVSLIELTYPHGASYTYRFRSNNEQHFPSRAIKTDRFGVGSGTGFHPTSAETEDLPTILSHHIESREGGWTVEQSRTAAATAELGFPLLRYACQGFADSLVCAIPVQAP
jgi:hypothetical protein